VRLCVPAEYLDIYVRSMDLRIEETPDPIFVNHTW